MPAPRALADTLAAPSPPAPASRAQGTDTYVFEFTLSRDGSLVSADGEIDSVIAALSAAATSTGLDFSLIEVGIVAARRRLLATFKVTVTFRGSSGDVQTLTVFLASATNQAALLAALLAEGLDASLLVLPVVVSVTSNDESWIGIPIGCSLARFPLRRSLCPDALATAPRARAQLRADAHEPSAAMQTLTLASKTQHPNQSGRSVPAVPPHGLPRLRAQEQGCVRWDGGLRRPPHAPSFARSPMRQRGGTAAKASAA